MSHMHSPILAWKQTKTTHATTPRSEEPDHNTTTTPHITTSNSINYQTCIQSHSPTPSDESDICLFTQNNTLPSTTMSYRGPLVNTVTTIEHVVVNQPPIVSIGELIPWTVYDFEQFCENYFTNTKTLIPEDKKVIQILPSFQDPLIWDWVASCQPHLSTLLFTEFIKELQTEWLPCNWEDKIWSQILNSHLNVSQSFSVWANLLQALNCTLWGTKSHLTPATSASEPEWGRPVDFSLH